MAKSIVCRLHQNTSHMQSEDAGSVKMAVFEHFSGMLLVLGDYLRWRAEIGFNVQRNVPSLVLCAI